MDFDAVVWERLEDELGKAQDKLRGLSLVGQTIGSVRQDRIPSLERAIRDFAQELSRFPQWVCWLNEKSQEDVERTSRENEERRVIREDVQGPPLNHDPDINQILSEKWIPSPSLHFHHFQRLCDGGDAIQLLGYPLCGLSMIESAQRVLAELRKKIDGSATVSTARDQVRDPTSADGYQSRFGLTVAPRDVHRPTVGDLLQGPVVATSLPEQLKIRRLVALLDKLIGQLGRFRDFENRENDYSVHSGDVDVFVVTLSDFGLRADAVKFKREFDDLLFQFMEALLARVAKSNPEDEELFVELFGFRPLPREPGEYDRVLALHEDNAVGKAFILCERLKEIRPLFAGAEGAGNEVQATPDHSPRQVAAVEVDSAKESDAVASKNPEHELKTGTQPLGELSADEKQKTLQGEVNVVPPPEVGYLNLIVNMERCEVSRGGAKYAHVQPIKLAGDVEWPLFQALFRKAGDELTTVELGKIRSESPAAKRMAKVRLNAKLLPLDVKVPEEWRLIDSDPRNEEVAPMLR